MEVCGFCKTDEIAVCRIIDKLDKIGEEGVRAELLENQFDASNVNNLLETISKSGTTDELIEYISGNYGDNERIRVGIDELREVMAAAVGFGVDINSMQFDLSLSRGLDYYTGTIFESVIPEQPHIGSLTGGGRYDELIGLFSKNPIPAVGITIGLDRIIAALSDAGKIQSRKSPTRVLVTIFDSKFAAQSIELTRKLRDRGISCEVYLESKKIGKQFAYADSQGIPFVVIIGEKEIERSTYSLKNMKSGDQTEVNFDELIAGVQ